MVHANRQNICGVPQSWGPTSPGQNHEPGGGAAGCHLAAETDEEAIFLDAGN